MNDRDLDIFTQGNDKAHRRYIRSKRKKKLLSILNPVWTVVRYIAILIAWIGGSWAFFEFLVKQLTNLHD